MKNEGWLSSDMQAYIDPPPIPIFKVEVGGDYKTHIIKVEMRKNPSSAASETYNVNMNMFDVFHP